MIDSRGQCLAHPQLDLIFTGASSLLPNDWHKAAVEAFQRKSTHRSVHYTSQQRRSSLSFPLVSKSASRATELQSIQTNMDCALSRLRLSDRISTVKCIVEIPKTLLIHHRRSSSGFWAVSAGLRGPLSQSSSERLRRELVWVQRSSSIGSNVKEPLRWIWIKRAAMCAHAFRLSDGSRMQLLPLPEVSRRAAGQSSHRGFIRIKMHPKQRGGNTHGFKVKENGFQSPY